MHKKSMIITTKQSLMAIFNMICATCYKTDSTCWRMTLRNYRAHSRLSIVGCIENAIVSFMFCLRACITST